MNVFARELVLILGSRGKELGALFSLKVPNRYGPGARITQGTVVRLKRSLTEPISATLNPVQLDALEHTYQLTPTEMERLKAALLAEYVRAQLMNRMPTIEQADQLGEVAFQLLLGGNTYAMRHARDELVFGSRDLDTTLLGRNVMRGAPSAPNVAPLTGEEAALLALDPPYELFEQAQLALVIARDTSDADMRLGYVTLARHLLSKADEGARLASGRAQGSDAQRDLIVQIAEAQVEASQIV